MGPSASTEPSKPQQPKTKPICGAKRRRGGVCHAPAGMGTDHLGYGACRFHLGDAPTSIKHAAKLEARHLAVELDMEPHDALLWCIRVTAGEVAYATRRISELEEDALLVRHERERVWTGGESGGGAETITSTDVRVHVWVDVRAHAVDRLAKYAKMALDAGVAERQVRIAEQLGGELADLLSGILGDLGLSAAQQKAAPEVVRRHLVALEGGVAA